MGVLRNSGIGDVFWRKEPIGFADRLNVGCKIREESKTTKLLA